MEKNYKKMHPKFQSKPHPKYPLGEAKVIPVANQMKLKLKTFFGNQGSQIFSLKFSSDNKMIATGTIDGDIKVYNVAEGKTLTVARSWHKAQNATTCLKWKPKQGQTDPHHLTATSTEGTITWLKYSGQILGRAQLNSPVMCCDYSSTGENVIVGKEDFSIEVFDDDTKSTSRLYLGSTIDNQNKNHSNRVFSIKSVPEKKNEFISGGWDSNVKIWDLRQKESVRNIFGPHISGDSIGFRNGQILTGSYRNNDILQIWDYGTGKLIQTLNLQLQNHQASYCYTAQFGSNGLIGSGLSVCNQVVFHQQNQTNQQSTIVGKIQLHDTCYGIDFSENGRLVALGGAEGVVYVFGI